MGYTKADIIAALQKDILLLQGFKPASTIDTGNAGLNAIRSAFPNYHFPIGAMHEFIYNNPEDGAATSAFVAGITASLMQKGSIAAWISSVKNIFPPALTAFGIQPQHIIFIQLPREKDKLWVMEEALKCEALAAVVSDIKEVSFTESRRLQLAVESSRVTGFLLRNKPKNFSTAAVTRWKITSLPAQETELPGVNFPTWNVELLKVRNGKPGTWQMQWKNGFTILHQQDTVITEPLRKVV